MAVLLAALSLAGCGNEMGSPQTLPGDTFTVTYKAGNGNGGSVVVTSTNGGEINLPGQEGFTAPNLGTESAPEENPMVFAGWNDRTFTYKAGHKYTVTDNVTFEARWGFTSKEDVKAYFDSMGDEAYKAGNNILLVACDNGETALTAAALKEMVDQIPSSGNPTVELDLSAATLEMTDVELDLSGISNLSVLILPRTTETITELNASAQVVSGLNVNSIESYAFSNCESLTTAYFPKAKTIGTNAFEGCPLTKADFPEATIIGGSAFFECESLATAYFLKATTIGTSAFYNCPLTKADFPEATDILPNAFDSTSLATAYFPKAEAIGANAFSRCGSLTEANFPVAKIIGAKAFNDCILLATITIGADCVISEPDSDEDSISKGFREAYTDTTQAAGTYTRDTITGEWTGPAS
jgi:uncharacterized protein YjbI with pentapeptide repeats